MNIRTLIFAAAIATSFTGVASAQTTNTQNGNGSQNSGGNFGGSFGGSFTFTGNGSTISQSFGDDGSFCQFFSFSSSFAQIVQILQGNTVTQTFGSATTPADPCI